MCRIISYTKLEKIVKGMIKESRFEHSVRVKETAVILARRFAQDLLEAAAYVGIFHDAYRYLSGDELLKECKKAKIKIEDEEKENPMLLHGAVAAIHFKEVAGVSPAGYFEAIRNHTLGSITMGRLGALLYIADFIEPGRTHLTDEDRAEILSHDTLEGVVLDILTRDLKYGESIGRKGAKISYELKEYLEKGGRFA